MPANDFAKGLVVPRILWAAFVVSHLTFAGVFWLLRTNQPAPPPPEPALPWILAALGTVLATASPGARGVMLAKVGAGLQDHEPRTLLAAYFVPLILSFALCESAALFGGVLLLLGAEPIFWAVPAVFGFGFHLVSMPSAGRLEAWQQTLAGKR
jgi:hypothetical protein